MTPERKALESYKKIITILREDNSDGVMTNELHEATKKFLPHNEKICFALQAIETIGRENIERLVKEKEET